MFCDHLLCPKEIHTPVTAWSPCNTYQRPQDGSKTFLIVIFLMAHKWFSSLFKIPELPLAFHYQTINWCTGRSFVTVEFMLVLISAFELKLILWLFLWTQHIIKPQTKICGRKQKGPFHSVLCYPQVCVKLRYELSQALLKKDEAEKELRDVSTKTGRQTEKAAQVERSHSLLKQFNHLSLWVPPEFLIGRLIFHWEQDNPSCPKVTKIFYEGQLVSNFFLGFSYLILLFHFFLLLLLQLLLLIIMINIKTLDICMSSQWFLMILCRLGLQGASHKVLLGYYLCLIWIILCKTWKSSSK